MLRMSAQQQEPRENIMSNAQVVRNPVGRQYKGRRYADRYAAGLQQSWGGAQSDGSTVEIVVDPMETPEGRRRTEERRGGQEGVVLVDYGGRGDLKKKKKNKQ